MSMKSRMSKISDDIESVSKSGLEADSVSIVEKMENKIGDMTSLTSSALKTGSALENDDIRQAIENKNKNDEGTKVKNRNTNRLEYK